MAKTEPFTVFNLSQALFYIERVAMVNVVMMPHFTRIRKIDSLFSASLFIVSHAGYIFLHWIVPNTLLWEICDPGLFFFERIPIIIWLFSDSEIQKFTWGIITCLFALSNMFHVLKSFVWNFNNTMPEELNTNAAELDEAEADNENSLLEQKCGNFEELAGSFLAAEFTENTRTENIEANDPDEDEAAETKHNLEDDRVSFEQKTEDGEHESAIDDIPTLMDKEVKLQMETMKFCHALASISSEVNALIGTTRGSNKDREIISKLENEKKNLSAKLNAANKSLEQYRIKEIQFTDEQNRLQEERYNLSEELLSTTYWYQHYLTSAQDSEAKYSAEVEEKSRLGAKLQAADEHFMSMSEYYQFYNRDLERTCCELRQDNVNLRTMNSTQSTSVQCCSVLVNEYKEKVRLLQENNSTLTAKLVAAEAKADVYRSLLRDANP